MTIKAASQDRHMYLNARIITGYKRLSLQPMMVMKTIDLGVQFRLTVITV